MTTLRFLILVMVVSIGLACSPKATTDNSHAGMDHNMNMPMDHNGMDHSNMDHSMMQSSPNAASAPYDLQFLDTMIAHHQGAVEMAGPAEKKAQHAEVITLAKNIMSSQNQEIAQMKEWRGKWFAGSAPAINMEMAGMMGSMKGMDMKKLGGLTGNAFDLEFISEMIPHHEGAVVMAREALERSPKPEIKTLARAIITAQEAEIAQMKGWQTTWK